MASLLSFWGLKTRPDGQKSGQEVLVTVAIDRVQLGCWSPSPDARLLAGFHHRDSHLMISAATFKVQEEDGPDTEPDVMSLWGIGRKKGRSVEAYKTNHIKVHTKLMMEGISPARRALV